MLLKSIKYLQDYTFNEQHEQIEQNEINNC